MLITRARAFKRQPGWQSAEAYHLGANVFDPVAHKFQGSSVTSGTVEAVNNNIVAHDLFPTGTIRARESGGAITVEAFSNCCLQLIPDVFICSISHSILENPVATVDGKANLALWNW